jgi:hypothetical protein
MAPHTGQSSQLPVDTNDGNNQFLSTFDIGVKVSHGKNHGVLILGAVRNDFGFTHRLWE